MLLCLGDLIEENCSFAFDDGDLRLSFRDESAVLYTSDSIVIYGGKRPPLNCEAVKWFREH